MPYNEKYFFEFDTLKTADKAIKYYRVVFSKLEDIAYTYDLVELKGSNSPFVLSYRSPEDNAFSPIKTSSAEINIFYSYKFADTYPLPEEFLNNTGEATWLVQFYELTSAGTVSTLKWQGFLINDVQYEWQDEFYYRLTATDNLAVLKDVKFSDDNEFKMPDYVPTDGISVKDFVIELVNKTGNTLNYKFAWELYNNTDPITLDILYTSLYTMVDWKTFQPKSIYPVLEDLLRTLGCIIYQDNNDATWTILNVPEIGTRTDNEVPYTEYDSDGVLVTTGVIELNSSINTGATDLVWRDKNQIVSFLKPIGGYEIEVPYQPKNLLQNYSFQEDTGSHPGWYDVGTFSSNVGFGSDNFFGAGYDDYYLEIDSSEANNTSLDVSNYFTQIIDLSETKLVNRSFRIYFQFKTYCPINPGTNSGEGFNFQLYQVEGNGGSNIFYDTEEIVDNRTNGGQWVNSATSTNVYRTPVFSDPNNPYKNITMFTRPASIADVTTGIQPRFLKYRYDPGVASDGEYKLDELLLALNPLQYRYLEKLKFVAYFNPRFSRIQSKSIFTGGFQDSDWYVLEGCLGLVDPDAIFTTRYYCNALWDRHWETHDESTWNYLEAIVSKSIISFYRSISRKFTGNIWGEEISYPKYFEVDNAVNSNAPVEIANAFEARVLADIGEIETSLCGSNYLTEYYELQSKFLMVEATFDYAKSTTLVNLHEDLTSTIETGFTANFGGLQFGQGVLPGSYGSSEDSNAEPITPS